MQIYVVGGYVRDMLLGLDPKDMDFVVVGATPEELEGVGQSLSLGFKKVGADFPVYLDKHKREWALARTERKTGPGYRGFECQFDSTVTLQEDLYRRDLTINAMALEVYHLDASNLIISDEVIDPYSGQDDLNSRTLRPVSNHFMEDPVRVLRVARFAARYGFEMSTGMIEFINQMTLSGELDHLVPERVWAEMEKAFATHHASRFFTCLGKTKALSVLFPELKNFADDGELRSAFDDCLVLEDKIAILVSRMHPEDAKTFVNRFIPPKHSKLALKYNKLLSWISLLGKEYTSTTVESLFKDLKVYNDKDFFVRALFIDNCFPTVETDTFPIVAYLSNIFDHTVIIGYDDLSDEDKLKLSGPEIGDAIAIMRRTAIRNFIRDNPL